MLVHTIEPHRLRPTANSSLGLETSGPAHREMKFQFWEIIFIERLRGDP